MKKFFGVMLAFALVLSYSALAQAACPNAAMSVTIPLSGSASVAIYDQSCNVLGGPYTVANGTGPSPTYPAVTTSTSPAVQTVSGQLQFSANGALAGTNGHFYVCFTPANQCQTMTYSVGAPISSISFGTTTP
jgi:hypothetical protein